MTVVMSGQGAFGEIAEDRRPAVAFDCRGYLISNK